MNKKGKRVLSILLTFVMLLGIFPVQAMAVEDGGPDVYASDPADPSSGTPGQTPAGDNQPGGDDPDENQNGTSGENEAGKTPSGEGTPTPGADGILNPTGPEGRVNAPAPGSDGGSDDGADDNDGPGDDTPDDETKPEDKVWKAAIVGGRMELTFGKDDEYTLKSFHKVFPDNADIRARFWRENEENRYRSWIAELRGTENRVLALSMRDGKGDDKVYAFDNLVEFYLTCKDWEGKTLSEMNERQFALYLLNSDGELGTAQTLFQVMDGAPALFFSTNMLADLLLNEPTQEEKDRRKQEAEEEAARLAELAKQQEEEEKKNAETIDDDSGDENKNEQITDNTNLENNEKLKEEKKEDLEEEEKEEEEEEKEEKEKLKEETKEEEPVIYIPQEQTLGDTTVTAQVPEGSLNEYAHLSLTSFNSEMTEAFKSAILTTVNAGVEEQPDENEQSDEEAAGEDGQASAAKKQEIASIILMDISFQAGENNYTPEKPVILTIQDDAIKSMTAPQVYHYAGGLAEDLTESATIDKEAGTVTFPASAFSPYAVADLADEGSVKAEKEEQEKEEEKQPAREEEQLDDQDAVDVSNHPLVEVEASDYEPLLDWFQLSPQTQALLGMGPQAPQNPGRKMLKAAPRLNAAAGEEGGASADGVTIEKVSVKWLSKSTGSDEPAGQGTLELVTDTETVGNQQFQLDFAISGRDSHEPGTVEIVFPAYLWLNRYGNEPGNLTLSVPEDPETGADFAWRRVGDNIVITNVRRLSAAAKVMIQGTFRNVKAPDMVDIDVDPSSEYAAAANKGRSNPFSVTVGITTPNDNYISLTSNSIDVTIDTHVDAASATKSAYNTSTRRYYVYHDVGEPGTSDPGAAMALDGGNMPQEFLTFLESKLGEGETADDYSFARWYVSGSMTGSQPALMTVNDTYNGEVIHYLDPLHQETETLDVHGFLLGVQGAQVKDPNTGVYATGNVVSADGESVSAVLYDGYNTLPKSAYVWTAYRKADFPVEGDEYRIANAQTVKVTGWDDQVTTTKEASAETPFRLPITYSVKKVWNDQLDLNGDGIAEDYSGRRPKHQSFLMYYNEDLHTLQKVQVNEAGDWTYTWDDDGMGWQYKVRELGMSGNGYEPAPEGHEEDDEYLKDGVDYYWSYNSPNFMNIPSEEFSHTINRVYDEDGDLREYDRWWYSLEREEYDSETHTWTKYNKYNEEHVVRELVPFKEQKLEVGISKTRLNYGNSSLMSTSDRALNVLRRGNDVVVDYNVYGYGYIIDLTKNVEVENVSITDFGFKDVRLELEDNYGTDTMKSVDNTFLFDSALKLTPDDVEIAYVNLSAPTYLHYYQPDKYSPWTFKSLTAGDFANFDRPNEELWGLKDGEWVRFAVMSISREGAVTITPENGATVSNSRVTMPTGVWKVKTVMTIPGLMGKVEDYLDHRIDGARMSYSIGVRLLHDSETLQNRLTALFDANDYVMCTLDNFATINAYEAANKEGTEFNIRTSLDDQSRTWLHGRNHKEAVRQEKSFEMIENDQVKRQLKLHSKVTMTQQTNILEQAEYWDARAEGLIPSTETGTWYDLLPLGVLPDVNSVKLSSGDKIIDVYTVENYKESGRVLLVVKADVAPHVSYTNSWDPNPYKSDITYPKEGYKDVHTLEFDAYYAWDEARLYGIDNVRNVAAYEADENALGNIAGWSGEPDDPQKNHNQRAMDAVGDDKVLMTGLDPERPEGHTAFVYSGAVMKHDEIDFMAETQLRKYVTKDGLGSWSSGRTGRTQVTVYEGDYYTYMLYVASASETTTKNIILLDELESYVPTEDDTDDYTRGRWQGKFVSVDVSGLRELGIEPVVYYNTGDVNLDELKGDSESQTTEIDDPDLVINYLRDPAKGWTTTLPDDPSTVKAIALDLRKNQDGSNFELQEDQNLFCTVRMRARIYETSGEETDPFNVDPEARKQAENNDYAFNNIFLGCTQVDPVGRPTHAIINYDYVRVGILPFELKVQKIWDDANNTDGKRPNAITVHLLANGQRMDPDRTITLSSENDWSDGFAHVIQYDENGDWITYTFEEESADQNPNFNLDSYTQSIERQGENVTITNTHTPEKTSLPFSKVWENDDEGDNIQYRPTSITVRLMADGVFTGKTLVVKPDREGNWAGTFADLPKFTNPTGLSGAQHEIEYSVEEEPVYKYNDSYETDPKTGNIIITNSFWPYGDLRISKTVTNTTEVSEDQEFTFTLLLKDSEGNDLTEKYGYIKGGSEFGLIGNGDTFTLKGGEYLQINQIPSECTYEIIEAETPGFTLVSSSSTSGVVRAGAEHQPSFTNRYNAAGSQSVSLFKTLEGRTMTQYQFRFELVDKNEGSDTYDQVIRTASADAAGNAMFGRLTYTEADHGKTFIYEIREVDREKQGYTYDTDTFTVKVTVTDNGDGTMTCTPKYYKADGTEITDPADHENGVVFQNEYHAAGSVALRAWKQLPDGELTQYGPFEFELIGEVPVTQTPAGDAGDPEQEQPAEPEYQFDVLQTKACDEAGTITFDALNFTEKDVGKTFFYVIKEKKGTDTRVQYTDTVRGVELSVADNGNGTLAITQKNVAVTEVKDGDNITYIKGAETTELPIFVNHLEPGNLSVTKLTNWEGKEPDATVSFPFRLTLVGDEEAGIAIPEKITVLLTAVENTKTYTEEGNVVPEPSYTAQIPGVEQVQTETGIEYQVAVDENGGVDFNLYAGQKLTVLDLPSGLAYQFQESIPSGWTLEFENVAGVIVPDVTTAATYKNTYEPGKAVATVIATKRLDGKTPPEKKYAFELVDDNGATPDTENVPQTLWNHASGFVLFDLAFDTGGVYHYKIREVPKLIESVSAEGVITYSEDEDELRKIEFDENEYPVTINVVKITAVDGSETLTATVYYAADVPAEGSAPEEGKTPPQFQNKTRPGSLQITKVGQGLTTANEDVEFTFKVALSNDAGMPLTESGGMFWYAEESEETIEPEPAPGQVDPPEDSQPTTPAAVFMAPAGGRTLMAVKQNLMGVSLKAATLSVSSIEPTTSAVKASGNLNDGERTPSVKWTLYEDGTLIIEPINGVSGSFVGYGSDNDGTGWPWHSYRSSVNRLSVKGSVSVSGNLRAMFRNFNKMTEVDVSGLDTSKATNFYSMFYLCTSLKVLDIHNIVSSSTTSNLEGITTIVAEDSNLEYLDISGLTTISSASTNQMFRSASKLSVIVFGENFKFNANPSLTNSTWKRLNNPDPATPISSSDLIARSGKDLAGTWVRVGYNPNFTIAFDPNGATGTMDSITASLADPPTLPACTFESDLNFAGWSTDPNAILPEYADGAKYTGAAVGGQTITLYAIWMSEDSFLLNYDANGGYSRVQWQRVNGPADTVTMPVPTHPNNYEFLYWSTNQDGSGSRFNGTVSGADFNAAPGATVKLYAQFLDPSRRAQIVVEHWQQNTDLQTYSMFQTDRLGAFDLESQVTISNSRDYRGFVTPTKFKVLSGSSTTETEQDDGTTVTVVRGGVTVRYYYNRTHYHLAFDPNGGEGSMSNMEMTGGIPGKLPVNRFTKENAIFVGWNTAADGSGTNYGDGQSVNSIGGDGETVTLYAQWFSTDDAQQAEPTNGEYTVKCKANETIVFPSLPSGTHYTITEVDLPEGWTLSGIDPATGTVLSAERINVTATNVYSASGVANLVAHKSLPGETFNEGQFSFKLLDESGNELQVVTNSSIDSAEQALDEDGNPIDNVYFGTAPVYFDDLTFTQQGVYHYTIKEKVATGGSINYDTHEEHVTVCVTDRGDGRLITQVLYDESGANFRNSMSNGDLKVSKTVRNATALSADKSFVFTLYLFDKAGNEIREEYPLTKSNGEKTTITSGGATTLKDGEYFVVSELPHGSTYIAVETPTDGFELAEKQGDEGTIIAGQTQEASFVNAYTSKTDRPGGGGAVLEAKKILEGGKIGQEQFQFKLLDSSENLLETVFADGDGKVEFSALHYTLEDDGKTYTYYIEEVPGVIQPDDGADAGGSDEADEGEEPAPGDEGDSETIVADPNVIYDTHRERVTVTVNDNGDGTMTAAVKYSGETEEESQKPPVFTNKMKKGNLEITKILSNFESSEPATFVFDITASAGKNSEGQDIVVYTNVASLTFTGPDTKSVLLTGIPVGATVTVTEVYSGARYVAEVTEQTAVIQPADSQTPASVSFTNSYDNTGPGGHGILNSFTAVQSGDGYDWGGWKTDLNNPE